MTDSMDVKGLTHGRFDTLSLAPKERESRWESLLTPVTSPDRLNGEAFGGIIDAWYGNETMLCNVVANQQMTRRDARQLACGPTPVYTIMLVCHGRLRYQDGQQEHLLAPGDIVIEDMTEARTLVTEAHRTLQLLLPHEDPDAPLPPGLHGQVLARRHPATRLLARHLMALHGVVHEMSAASFRAQIRVVHALLSTALPAHLRQESDLSRLHMVLRAEVMRFVDAHLTAPWLSARALCQHFRMSRTHLYRLFKGFGGPSAFIRYRRLCEAARRISHSPPDDGHWQDTAETLGFGTRANLERAFENTFQTPLASLASAEPEAPNPRNSPVEELFQRFPADAVAQGTPCREGK